jgi:hypothetical protein
MCQLQLLVQGAAAHRENSRGKDQAGLQPSRTPRRRAPAPAPGAALPSRMRPRSCLLPPPLIVPLSAISWPSMVTTRAQRLSLRPAPYAILGRVVGWGRARRASVEHGTARAWMARASAPCQGACRGARCSRRVPTRQPVHPQFFLTSWRPPRCSPPACCARCGWRAPPLHPESPSPPLRPPPAGGLHVVHDQRVAQRVPERQPHRGVLHAHQIEQALGAWGRVEGRVGGGWWAIAEGPAWAAAGGMSR